MNKYVLLMGMVCFWVFMPFIFLYFSYNNFVTLQTDVYREITANDFNILSFGGISTAFRFFLELGRFSIAEINPFVSGILLVLFLLSIIFVFLYLRSGG